MNNIKLEKYLNENKTLNFNELLFSFIDDKNLKDSDVYRKINMDRKLFSKIRCNFDYIPKKVNVIKLCLSLNLNLIDTNKLLNSAGYSLSYNDKFDLIISYCIENNIYDLNIINDYLYSYTSATL